MWSEPKFTVLRSLESSQAEDLAGSHWKLMTSGHFDALAACGVNAQ